MFASFDKLFSHQLKWIYFNFIKNLFPDNREQKVYMNFDKTRVKLLTIIGQGWAKYRDLSVASRSIICLSLRQIIDLLTTFCDNRVQ